MRGHRLREQCEPGVGVDVLALDEAVGEQDERGAVRQKHAGVGTRPLRQRRADRVRRAAVQLLDRTVRQEKQRRWMAGVAEHQHRVVAVQQEAAVERRRERGHLQPLNQAVEPVENGGRAAAVVGVRAQDAAQLTHRDGGVHVVSHGVADRQRHRAVRQREGVVPVTAHLRLLGTGEVDRSARHAGRIRHGRHHPLLQGLRDVPLGAPAGALVPQQLQADEVVAGPPRAVRARARAGDGTAADASAVGPRSCSGARPFSRGLLAPWLQKSDFVYHRKHGSFQRVRAASCSRHC